jgi:hypothetical protein
LDLGAITSESFIDRVIDNLIDEVVEAALTSRADIHAWALTDRVEPLEDGNSAGVVAFGLCHPNSFNQTGSEWILGPISYLQPVILVIKRWDR